MVKKKNQKPLKNTWIALAFLFSSNSLGYRPRLFSKPWQIAKNQLSTFYPLPFQRCEFSPHSFNVFFCLFVWNCHFLWDIFTLYVTTVFFITLLTLPYWVSLAEYLDHSKGPCVSLHLSSLKLLIRWSSKKDMSWGRKELGTTEQLNWTELNWGY